MAHRSNTSLPCLITAKYLPRNCPNLIWIVECNHPQKEITQHLACRHKTKYHFVVKHLFLCWRTLTTENNCIWRTSHPVNWLIGNAVSSQSFFAWLQGDVGSRGLPGLPGPPGEGLQGPLVFGTIHLDRSHHFKVKHLNTLSPIYWAQCLYVLRLNVPQFAQNVLKWSDLTPNATFLVRFVWLV